MFTRAVITDEISQDLELAARMAQGFGLDQLEIRTAWDVRVDNMSRDELGRVKDIASAAGLGVVCIASPFLKCDLGNDAEYAEHLQILRRSIAAAQRFAAEIEAGMVRVNRPTVGAAFNAPFGGIKQSGTATHREQLGPTVMDFYTVSRTVWLGS